MSQTLKKFVFNQHRERLKISANLKDGKTALLLRVARNIDFLQDFIFTLEM